MTLLIDADLLIYSACSACEYDVKWDDTLHTLHLEEGDVKDFITMRVDRWQELVGDDQVVMCLSDYPSFRYDLLPQYKANRIGKRKPLGMQDIRYWMQDQYACGLIAGLEADDVMGIFATNDTHPNPVIVSIDKDMRTVPCSLLAKDMVETVSQVAADRAWMRQTLTGDSTDNYPGLKGVGPVTADKILGDATTLPELWARVVQAYQKGGLTWRDALLNARMARILRHGDYDFDQSAVRLWEPAIEPRMTANG